MKLRSGKILPSPPIVVSRLKPSVLPEALDNDLKNDLQCFKTLFSSNPKHAKELLDIISQAQDGGIRFAIRDKMEEITDPRDPNMDDATYTKKATQHGAAGDLACLLILNPQYHDIISERIQTFELETPLLGTIDEI
jgi:hypothetical protein